MTFRSQKGQSLAENTMILLMVIIVIIVIIMEFAPHMLEITNGIDNLIRNLFGLVIGKG